jgi:hypothetical protein
MAAVSGIPAGHVKTNNGTMAAAIIGPGIDGPGIPLKPNRTNA